MNSFVSSTQARTPLVNEPSHREACNDNNLKPQHPSLTESEAVSTLTKSKLLIDVFLSQLGIRQGPTLLSSFNINWQLLLIFDDNVGYRRSHILCCRSWIYCCNYVLKTQELKHCGKILG